MFQGWFVIDVYLRTVRLIERMHRHFLDVLRVELRKLGIEDINSVQALLLFNIGEEEVVIRDLKDRGYYHGSNVSYNVKKLTEFGYLEQERSTHDRRSVRLRLSEKGVTLCNAIRKLQNDIAASIAEDSKAITELDSANRAMHHLERVWTDYVRYG
jgi:DNA-binding MarR family transcriptional regulator